MNNIKTSDITDPSIQQPFTGLSLAFLQNATTEAIKAICYSFLGEWLYAYSTSAGSIVSGCTKSGSGNTMFNGFIYYKGELYYLPGAAGLLAYTLTPVFLLDETNDPSIDPVEFSDSVFRSVHKIRRLKVVDQASGSGLFDMSQLGRIVGEKEIIATATNTPAATAGALAVTASSFVSPARVCDLEITVTARMTITADGANECGAVLRIYNTTTSTTLSQTAASLGATVPNTQVHKFPISVRKIIRSVAANNTIELTLQNMNGGAPGITLDNIYIGYREIVRPAMW